MTLYVDGTLAAQTTLNCPPDSTYGGIRRGHVGYSDHGNGYHFEGNMDMFAIYDSSLSAQEVLPIAAVLAWVPASRALN